MIKCTTLLISGRYEITGLLPLNDGKYEMVYLHRFGNKNYKTENNAIKAIQKVGYEFVKVNREDLVVGLN